MVRKAAVHVGGVSFAGDSLDYEMLAKAAQKAPGGRDLAWIEIGTRAGASCATLMEQASEGQTIISVDPYGGIPYLGYGELTPEKELVPETLLLNRGDAYKKGIWEWRWVPGFCLEYDSKMRRTATEKLLWLAGEKRLNFVPLPFEDSEFMKRFADGVPVYYEGHKQLLNTYGLVFLDGPHDAVSVRAEIEFFAPRLAREGLLVIDDHLEGARPKFWQQLKQRFGLVAISTSPTKMVLRRGIFMRKDEKRRPE